MNDKYFEDLYLRIIDQFPNPIWRAGLDTKCDYFNKAWLEFTGRKIEQEMGNGWVEGVHKDDLDACVKTYLDSFKAHKLFSMKYRLKHNDGTYHWLLDCGAPFFDGDKNFLGYIGSCYEINEDETSKQEKNSTISWSTQ
ncbi:MAG: PAS domain-containing protein [bacterium]